jgi:hypothetical protein
VIDNYNHKSSHKYAQESSNIGKILIHQFHSPSTIVKEFPNRKRTNWCTLPSNNQGFCIHIKCARIPTIKFLNHQACLVQGWHAQFCLHHPIPGKKCSPDINLYISNLPFLSLSCHYIPNSLTKEF